MSFTRSTVTPSQPTLKAATDSAEITTARREIEGTLIVSAAGEIDLATIEPFRLQVTHALESQASRIVIDLREVTFLDSTTLSELVRAHNHLTAQGRALTIRTGQAFVLRLFEITGLSGVLHIQD